MNDVPAFTYDVPDNTGHFGIYGGRVASETLMPLLAELAREYEAAKAETETCLRLPQSVRLSSILFHNPVYPQTFIPINFNLK